MAVAALGSAAAMAGTVSAHDLGNDSVDGGEIRWEDHTHWDTERQYAIDLWHGQGCVDILHDAWNTVTDLEFHNYDDSNVSTFAYWEPRTGADIINFNDHWFDQFSPAERKKTAIHEVGHALRFDHTSNSTSVMRQGQISQTWLGSHDTSDYDAQWC